MRADAQSSGLLQNLTFFMWLGSEIPGRQSKLQGRLRDLPQEGGDQAARAAGKQRVSWRGKGSAQWVASDG